MNTNILKQKIQMKAIILEKAGSVENLVMQEIAQPTIKANQVLVEVKAISVNPVDYKLRSSEDVIRILYGSKRPIILGWDIAGIVAAIGNEVSQFAIGDRVFGMINFPGAGDAYAEYVAASESHLAKIPTNVSFEEAAATTLAALTALQVLQGKVKKNDRVLIQAGSGGVGHYAIQIAKSMGAYVITTSSAKNRDFVMSLGADEHIDYRTQKFDEVLSNIDFVLDSMGYDVLLDTIKVMKDGGQIVSLAIFDVAADLKEAADKKDVTVLPFMVQSNGVDMNTLKALLESGAVKAHISKTFAFSEMAAAHLELESGRTVGKIVVNI